MFTWPETLLPLPNVNFNVDRDFSKAQTRMSSGKLRQRPRFSEARQAANVTFELDKDQYATFVAVWRYSLNRGNDWFTMRIPEPDGNELTLTTVRFISNYNSQHRNKCNWDITGTIEIEETSLSEAELAILLAGEALNNGNEASPEVAVNWNVN